MVLPQSLQVNCREVALAEAVAVAVAEAPVAVVVADGTEVCCRGAAYGTDGPSLGRNSFPIQ